MSIPESRRFIRMHVPVLDLGAAWKYFLEPIVESRSFLDSEVVDCKVQVSVAGVTYG